MGGRVRIFVDYWNFQLNWNERAGEARCDWLALPDALMRAVRTLPGLKDAGYEGIQIYASVDPGNENLLNWLETFLDRQPGFEVRIARMVRRQRGLRCTSCGNELVECPECAEPFTIGTSKGLTTATVCDLLSLCLECGCDVPLLVTSDTELMPAVELLRRRGLRVIHAGWRETGHDLARAAWASLDLDTFIPDLIRA
jgi:hypothetical protein